MVISMAEGERGPSERGQGCVPSSQWGEMQQQEEETERTVCIYIAEGFDPTVQDIVFPRVSQPLFIFCLA